MHFEVIISNINYRSVFLVDYNLSFATLIFTGFHHIKNSFIRIQIEPSRHNIVILSLDNFDFFVHYGL